ncbi:MAG TPA: divalent-cation tolerance protein CutA [Verrucomicrobiae bacterium]|nr:divalent-cation tolerance protein CutA [Verrucomicrobiae bacterium]
MKNSGKFRIVLVTAPNLKIARKLSRITLESRLAACANLVPKIESHYWWQGKIEHAAEVLIFFKTPARNLQALENLILANHPYDTPEFLVLQLAGGNARYLDWLESTCISDKTEKSGKG